MVRDIYRNESQILVRLFAGGGKFLVVPLDFAKTEHTAQCCTQDGDYVWKSPLRAWNNLRGVDFLLECVGIGGIGARCIESGLLRAGENQLEIAVTNNWANAIIGDEQIPADYATADFPAWLIKGQPWPSARKTYTTCNYYKKDSELKPAGLVGPVQLCFLAEVGL